jgi:hypothetical protein
MPPKRKSAYTAVMREVQQQRSEERPEVQQSERPDMQQSNVLDTQTLTSPEVQKSTSPETEKPSTPDSRKSKHPEWEQQTVYLAPALKDWLRVHAARSRLEISEIVNMALKDYQERHP